MAVVEDLRDRLAMHPGHVAPMTAWARIVEISPGVTQVHLLTRDEDGGFLGRVLTRTIDNEYRLTQYEPVEIRDEQHLPQGYRPIEVTDTIPELVEEMLLT